MNGVVKLAADRRKHQRVAASEMSYVVGLALPGIITDVSEGGIGIKYKGSEELPEEFVVDLLNAAKSATVRGVRCRKARDETMGRISGFSYVPERRLGLQFLEPTLSIIDSLDLFRGLES